MYVHGRNYKVRSAIGSGVWYRAKFFKIICTPHVASDKSKKLDLPTVQYSSWCMVSSTCDGTCCCYVPHRSSHCNSDKSPPLLLERNAAIPHDCAQQRWSQSQGVINECGKTRDPSQSLAPACAIYGPRPQPQSARQSWLEWRITDFEPDLARQ